MSTTKKWVSLEKLSLYHDKEVARVAAEDAKVLAAAKEYADGLGANYDAAGAAATVQGNLDTEILRAKAREDEIAGLVATAQDEVDALETLVGTLPEGTTATSVVDYVNVKTAGIATDAALGELQGQLTAAQGEINTIKGDYLKAADKTELQGNIDTLAGTHNTDKAALEASIKAISDDYLKAADKTELQGSIDTVSETLAAVKEDVDYFFKDALGDSDAQQVKDTLKELQEYIASDESGAATMAGNIQQNANDIDALEGKMTTVEGKVSTLEGEMDDAQAAIEALQGVVGEGGSVDSKIAAAVKVETDARVEAVSAVDTKAQKGIDDAAAALAAANAASAHADELNTAMDTRVKVVEGKAHTHANQAELDLIASGDKAKWDAAAAKAHEHANKAVIDGITAENVTAWSAAEGNAKGYADGLNTAMDTRMVAVEQGLAAFVEVSEAEINALFE